MATPRNRRSQADTERPAERTRETPEEVTHTAPKPQPKQLADLTYGDEITVETTGNFGLFDPETGTSFDSKKSTTVPHSRFTESMIGQGKLKLA